MFTEINIDTISAQQWPLLVYVLVCSFDCFSFCLVAAMTLLLSTYIMIFLSFVFWSLMVLRRSASQCWGFALLTLTVLVQPWKPIIIFL